MSGYCDYNQMDRWLQSYCVRAALACTMSCQLENNQAFKRCTSICSVIWSWNWIFDELNIQFSLYWSCGSRQRDTTSSGWKFQCQKQSWRNRRGLYGAKSAAAILSWYCTFTQTRKYRRFTHRRKYNHRAALYRTPPPHDQSLRCAFSVLSSLQSILLLVIFIMLKAHWGTRRVVALGLLYTVNS